MSFSNSNSLATEATFAKPDSYELDLVARDTDGSIIGVDTVVINVEYAQLTVDAGNDQTIDVSDGHAILQGDVLGGDADTNGSFMGRTD